MKQKWKLIIGLIIALVLWGSYQRIFHGKEIDKTNVANKIKWVEEAKKDSLDKVLEKEVETQEYFISNCHFMTKKAIQKLLKNPESFDELSHQEFLTTKKKNSRIYAQCVIEYTAINSFNGKIREKKTASFDSIGAMIDIF
jgi:hypothetical protein